MKYIDLKKILYMDSLIQRKCTGSPEQFAQKVDLSRSAFFEYLSYMRNELLLEISYSSYKETYFYKGKDLCAVLGSIRCAECRSENCLVENKLIG